MMRRHCVEGQYLSPEPMLQSPAFTRWMARSGTQLASYAYAANNPLHYVDPTGLYQWKKPADRAKCANYDAALALAQDMFGCGADGKMNASCQCQAALDKCVAGCDVCAVLQDGAGPTITGLTSGLNEGGGYAFLQTLELDTDACTDPSSIRTLAKTLLHEAMHQCKRIGGGKDYEELPADRQDCAVDWITRQCFPDRGGQ